MTYRKPSRWERQLTSKYYLDEWKDTKSFKRRLEVIWKSLNRIPVWTYPAGPDAYWDEAEDAGLENWRGRHNIWRQAWHFLAGFSLGLFLPQILISILIGIKEAEEAYRNEKLYFKNILDLCVWSTGAYIGNYITFLYF